MGDVRPIRTALVTDQVRAALRRQRDAFIRGDRPILTGQEKARLRRACDNLSDTENELMYVVRIDPSLQPIIDQVIELLVDLTQRAYDKRTAPDSARPEGEDEDG